MTRTIGEWLSAPGLVVVYDGECPFCSAYVRMVRMREAVGPLKLVDARKSPDLITEAGSLGFELDEGMLAIYGGRVHAGSDAMTLLSILSTPSGLLNRLFAWLFAKPTRARMLYPALRMGRRATLRLMGRKPIGRHPS